MSVSFREPWGVKVYYIKMSLTEKYFEERKITDKKCCDCGRYYVSFVCKCADRYLKIEGMRVRGKCSEDCGDCGRRLTNAITV